MFRWLLPDLDLLVGRDRVEAARLCEEHFPDAVLVLDDGFQHLPLRKHIGIVLDPSQPSNTHCLPAGPYREPRRNRSRADLVLPGKFSVQEAPLHFQTSAGEVVRPTRYGVLCALARPERFLASVEAAVGSPPAESGVLLLPDHDPLTKGNLFGGFPEGLPVVVTAKDWVKLRERSDIGGRSILIARHEVHVEPRTAFRDWLAERLDVLGS